MELYQHERFVAANQELRGFLRRTEAFARGTGTVTERELKTILARLQNLGPEVGDASRSETLDAQSRVEIAEYVRNLLALQRTVENIRRVMLCRRAQLKAAKSHLDGLQSWIHAYQQTN